MPVAKEMLRDDTDESPRAKYAGELCDELARKSDNKLRLLLLLSVRLGALGARLKWLFRPETDESSPDENEGDVCAELDRKSDNKGRRLDTFFLGVGGGTALMLSSANCGPLFVIVLTVNALCLHNLWVSRAWRELAICESL